MSDPLDNAVWHALATRHAGVAEVKGRARRYDPEVSVFAAIEDLDAAAWADLADLVGPGGTAVLFRPSPGDPPDGWETRLRGDGLQMVAPDVLTPVALPDVPIVELGPEHVDAMIELVRLTEPGPFLPRTNELGRYVGVIEDGRLVAMAGERLNLPGHTEVSAVCTHPDVQGRGLAALLVTDVVHAIQARGDTAFLHMRADNHAAYRVYERLGFTTRTHAEVLVVVLK